MKNLPYSFIILISACLSFLTSSCLPTPQTSAVSKKVTNFDYQPEEIKAAGSAKMSIALIDPAYNKTFTYSSLEMFQRFGNSLEADIQEVLVAHGYSLKGPFASTDEMVITDKRDADLAMMIEINPEVISNGDWKSIHNIIYKYYTYMYSGNLSVLGKINLVAIEPLTGERVWVKSIEILVRDVKSMSKMSFPLKC